MLRTSAPLTKTLVRSGMVAFGEIRVDRVMSCPRASVASRKMSTDPDEYHRLESFGYSVL